jgi:hypothetical protein
MARLLIILAALALGACSNTVYSRLPLVGERHEGGDPEFRPGLYLISGFEDRCAFDIRLKLSLWPDCAVGAEFRRGQMWLLSNHQRILAQTQRFIGGDPVIVQSHWSTDVLKDPRAPEPKNAENPFFGWTYTALTVTRTDPAGRIMEAALTPALCGPLAPGKTVTERPFAGLALSKDNCVAQDFETVRTALALSGAIAEPRTIRWIRDNP